MISFITEARRFLKSIISQRLQLDQLGKSKNPSAGSDAKELLKYLKAYPYQTSNQMASFLINNQGKILNIIPGSKSGSSNKQSSQFNELYKKAQSIQSTRSIPTNFSTYGLNAHYQIG